MIKGYEYLGFAGLLFYKLGFNARKRLKSTGIR